jgi:hypothetical protein
MPFSPYESYVHFCQAIGNKNVMAEEAWNESRGHSWSPGMHSAAAQSERNIRRFGKRHTATTAETSKAKTTIETCNDKKPTHTTTPDKRHQSNEVPMPHISLAADIANPSASTRALDVASLDHGAWLANRLLDHFFRDDE